MDILSHEDLNEDHYQAYVRGLTFFRAISSPTDGTTKPIGVRFNVRTRSLTKSSKKMFSEEDVKVLHSGVSEESLLEDEEPVKVILSEDCEYRLHFYIGGRIGTRWVLCSYCRISTI